ncbi:MAG: undecaprenyl-diphosphate phosphatase [Patescibacteria group bacterium]
MDIVISIILGAVQGITEFLPVSSTGHLVIVGALLGRDANSFAFDVLLNIGTLAALVWYTRDRIRSIVAETIRRDYSLALKILLGTIPAAIFGFFAEDIIAKLNDNIWLVAGMLVMVGFAMVFIREKPKGKGLIAGITYMEASLIGSAQMLALIPGTSRSGITILAGLLLGLRSRVAAEFSFLLAIPIISGATLKTLLSRRGYELLGDNFAEVMIGNLASFAVGLVAISALLRVISSSDLKVFGVYRIALGAVLIILLSANIL